MKRQISKLRTYAEKKGISHIYDLPLAEFSPHLYWIDLGTSKFLAGWQSWNELIAFRATFWKKDLPIYRMSIRPSDQKPKIELTNLPLVYGLNINEWVDWDKALKVAQMDENKIEIKRLKSIPRPKLRKNHIRVTNGKEIKLVPADMMSFESHELSIYIGLYIGVF
jgi:hypothetical protein